MKKAKKPSHEASAKNKRAKRSVAAEATHVLGDKKTPEASPRKRIAQLPGPVAELNLLVARLAAAPDQASGDALRQQILEGFYGRPVDLAKLDGTDVAKPINQRQRKRMARGIQAEITRYRSCLKLLRKLPGEVLKAGLVLFKTEAAVALWLCEPARSLGGKIPLRVAQTPVGAAEVVNTLTGLAHGMVL